MSQKHIIFLTQKGYYVWS